MRGLLKLLCFSIMFFSLAQPSIVFQASGENRTFFVLVGIAMVIFFIDKTSTGEKLVKLPQNKYLYGILGAYTLSVAQFSWLTGTMYVFVFWFKKIILLFLIVNVAKEVKDLRRLVWSILIAVTILSLMGWDMYLNRPYMLMAEGRLQAVGNYNQPNSFAFLLTLSIPLCLCLMQVEKGIIKKTFLMMFLISCVIGVIYTKSRGGAMGMLFAVCLSLISSERLLRFRWLKFATAGILICIFLVYAVPRILNRSDVTSYLGKGGEASAGDRLLAWVTALKMLRSNPILGVGWEMYEENSKKFDSKGLAVHNTPLSVLVETGIIGFFCFAAILITTFRQLWQMRLYWRQKEDKEVLFILSQGVLISLFCFLVNTSFSVKDHDPMYWAILTLAGVLCSIYKNEKALTGPMRSTESV